MAKKLTREKVRWLVAYWNNAAKRSQAMALTVSGEGEAAEIYRDTAMALSVLLALQTLSLGGNSGD